MKLAIAVIFALVCHMAIGDTVNKFCPDTTQYWDGTKCVACTAPCKQCIFKDSKESCIQCDTTHFLSLSGGIGSCGNCTGNCTTCRGPNAGDCVIPEAQFSLSPSAIVKCDKIGTCKWCSSENVCGKCNIGHRMDNGTCTLCSDANCAECPDAISTCKKCADFYELKDNTCKPCAAGCKNCPCTECNTGYSFNNGTCAPCSDLLCTDCAKNASECTECRAFSVLNTTTKSCTQCSTSCVECSSATKCTKCFPNYVIDDNGACVQCDDNCKDGKCNKDKTCIECDAQSYLDANKKCVKCPDGCDGCSADGVCKKCLSGYFAKEGNKGCALCTNVRCQECATATTCKTCDATSNLDDKASCKAFTECQRGEQLDDKGVCSAGTIDNCVYGNAVTKTCVFCAAAYYADGNKCSACPSGCQECSVIGGYVRCITPAQTGFSFVMNKGNKIDNAGYLGKDLEYTLNVDGNVDQCMPYAWTAVSNSNSSNHKCFDFDKCPILKHQTNAWTCAFNNAATVAMSLFTLVVATIITL